MDSTTTTKNVHRQNMDAAVRSLMQKVARQVASKASNEEQQHQALMHFRHQLCDDIRRVVAQANSIDALNLEQKMRLNESRDLKEIYDAKAPINEQITRRGFQQSSIDQMKVEQQRRTTEHKMKSVCEELVRTVNRKEVLSSMRNEQIERITFDMVKEVCEELRRVIAQKQANVAFDQARSERLNETTPQSTDERNEVLLALQRMGNQTRAKDLMEMERAARVSRDNVHRVCEELRRSVQQKSAAQNADDEKTRRIAFNKHRHEVCEEIRRVGSRREATQGAEKERQLRTSSESQYWVTDAAAISKAKHDVNADILKRGNICTAQNAAELEQQRRVIEQSMKEVCEELVRTVNRNIVTDITAVEQAQRICRDQTHEICNELRRVIARKFAIAMLDEEQKRRGSFASPSVSDAHRSLLDDIEQKGNQNRAIEVMELEREHRIHEHNMKSVCEEIERAVNINIAREATLIEQSQRVVRNMIHEVCDELRRTSNRKRVLKFTNESRLNSSMHIPEIDDTRRSVLDQIERLANQRDAIEIMEKERNARIHEDRMHDVCDQVRRHVSKKKALVSMKEVQETALVRRKLILVTDQLVQKHKRKCASNDSIMEKKRRMANPPTPTKEQQRLQRALANDIISVGA